MACVHHAARHLELPQLGHKNHNRQTVHKAQHHRMRHQPDKLAPLHHACKNLQQTHQHHSRKKVFNPVLRDQSHHDNCKRACRPRDHPRPPTDQRSNQPHQKGGVKPHQRRHSGDKRKGYSLGHQRSATVSPDSNSIRIRLTEKPSAPIQRKSVTSLGAKFFVKLRNVARTWERPEYRVFGLGLRKARVARPLARKPSKGKRSRAIRRAVSTVAKSGLSRHHLHISIKGLPHDLHKNRDHRRIRHL